MDINENIDAVDLVDRLMTHFRYGIQPDDADIVKAYELGISVVALKHYVEEVELGEQETTNEYEWDEYGEEEE